MRHITKILFSLLLLVLGFFVVKNNILFDQNHDSVATYSTPKILTSRDGIVLCFDCDDVISGKEKIGVLDYASLIPRLLYHNPKIVTALWPANFTVMCNKAYEIAQGVNGASNIIHEMVHWLNDAGYGDLALYEDELMERSIKPFVVQPMIENIQTLKKQGYVVIGATNQDYKQYQVYRKKMKQGGVDLEALFDAVLVTNVDHEELAEDDLLITQMRDKNIYALCKAQVCKPSEGYFQALEYLVSSLVPEYKEIIFTDDILKNIHGAHAAGLHGAHFRLPGGVGDEGGKMCDAPECEVLDTIDQWKKQIAALGVIIE